MNKEIIQTELTEDEIRLLYNLYWNNFERRKKKDTIEDSHIRKFFSNLRAKQ